MRFALILLALTACAAGIDDGFDPALDIPLTKRLTTRPVDVVAASNLPEECMNSITADVAWFRGLGVSMQVSTADPSDAVFNGVGRAGVIAIRTGTPSMRPGEITHGETEFAYTVNRDILGALITLASCNDLVIAHEIAHGLGLTHRTKIGNLMAPLLLYAGWELDPDQLKWIAF